MGQSKAFARVCVLNAALVWGCKGIIEIPDGFPTPPPPPPAAAINGIPFKYDTELEKQIAKIADQARGRVGVAAVVLETGDAAMLNANEHFPMQSVYKLPISMAVIDQIRLGDLSLDERIGVTKDDMVRQGMRSPLRDEQPNGGEFTIHDLISLAVVESDGTASDVLIRAAGGADRIQNFLTQIGIEDMRVVNTEKEIGRDWSTQYQNWATPVACVQLLRWLDRDAGGWKPPNLDEELDGSKLLLQFMFRSPTGPKRLKGDLPLKGPFSVVAHKTGTSGTQNGITAATNDIGILYLPNGKRVAIAVFVSDSSADEKVREAVIARVAKAVWDRWQ